MGGAVLVLQSCERDIFHMCCLFNYHQYGSGVEDIILLGNISRITSLVFTIRYFNFVAMYKWDCFLDLFSGCVCYWHIDKLVFTCWFLVFTALLNLFLSVLTVFGESLGFLNIKSCHQQAKNNFLWTLSIFFSCLLFSAEEFQYCIWKKWCRK